MTFAAAAGLLAGRGPTVAVDSTGLETRHVSAHYRGTRRRTGRRGRPRACYPTLTIATHTASHLIAGAVTGTGPAPDFAAFAPVMRQAAAVMPRIGAVVADAGFDAEPVHQLCRGPLGIRRTAIRLNPRRRLRTWPTTRYRRAMRRHFPRRLYRRRQQVESVFSRTKRRLGSALTARRPATQCEEIILRVLTHNLLLLRRRLYLFNRATLTPYEAKYFATTGSSVGCLTSASPKMRRNVRRGSGIRFTVRARLSKNASSKRASASFTR